MSDPVNRQSESPGFSRGENVTDLERLLTRLKQLPPDVQAEWIRTLPTDTRVALHRMLTASGNNGQSGYRWDPVGWAENRGIFLWSKQREILNALVEHRKVAVHAAHALGKSFVASVAIAWWCDTRTAGNAKAFSTAPTGFQVRSILWAEMNRLHAKLALPGRVNQTEWHLPIDGGTETMVAWGRKPSDHDEAAFQGVHAEEGVLAVGDEASGLAASLLDDLDKNLTGDQDRALLIGNPDNPSSAHASICNGDIPGWHVIHLDGLDSPNFTGEAVPDNVARSLMSRTFATDQAKYGETSARYLSRVRGKFPTETVGTVMSVSALAKASIPLDAPNDWPRILGVDVGGGGDLTVCQLREGQRATSSFEFSIGDPALLTQEITAVIVATGAQEVRIDSIGIGWGIMGSLDQAGRDGLHNAIVRGINVGQTANDPKRFASRRDEMWWHGRELCLAPDGERWDLSGAPAAAVQQLGWPKVEELGSGRVRVESKRETIKRHGHSPDHADALLMAFYDDGWVSSDYLVAEDYLAELGKHR